MANGNGANGDSTVEQVRTQLSKSLVKIDQLLPPDTSLTPQKIAVSAVMEVARSEDLQSCNPMSIVRSVLHAASLGLYIGPMLGEAYLVAFKGVCTLLPGYKGYVKLAIQTGLVRAIDVRLVYPDDFFDVRYGTTPEIVHRPKLFKLPGDENAPRRGDDDILAGYMVAHLHGSGEPKFEVMTREEVEKVKQSSRAKDAAEGPWKKWYAEQFKKSVIRRGVKLLPASIEDQRMQAALELDNRFDTGKVTATTSLLDDDSIAGDVRDMTKQRTEELRDRLASKPPQLGEGAASAQPIDADMEKEFARQDRELDRVKS